MGSINSTAGAIDFLAGGGEMGALIRSHDWSASSVGSPAGWPQGLRTAVRFILNTGHPMYIFWGEELLCFYNDAYSQSIGPERHPCSLGQPARAVWDEIWDAIGPQIDQVMQGRGAPWHENQLLPITPPRAARAGRWAETALKRMNDNLEAQIAQRTAERDRVWRNSRDLLVVMNAEGFLVAASPSWTSILGHLPEQVEGRHVEAFVWPDDAASTRLALDAAHTEERPNFENRYRHLDGTPRWLSWRTSVEQGIIYAYGRDITTDKAREAELERVEEALRQAQKMEAIGQLTGGIAHDFNNLLQSVSGNIELIRHKARESERVTQWAEAGLFAVRRGAKLTSQLLTFSRAQKLQLEPLDIAKLLPRMRDLLVRALGPSTVFDMLVADPSIVVIGDETQLEMALLNLAINARDAMPEGGRLCMSVAKKWMPTDFQLAAGEYTELAVEDSGSGMPPDVISRAFDPFFTTKGVGKGTGLGLSQVYGMTRQAGGAARISSAPGSGTTVYLYLPCTQQAVGATGVAASDWNDGKAPQALVLIVDDDDDVRRFLVDSVAALGYGTAQAADGQAAIAAYAQLRPDAVIVDFAMPGMNGAEVASRLRASEPDLPVVFASGFSETAAIERLPGAPALMLRKPFSIDELGDTLKGAIASRGAERLTAR